jgi:hypothetical protein
MITPQTYKNIYTYIELLSVHVYLMYSGLAQASPK